MVVLTKQHKVVARCHARSRYQGHRSHKNHRLLEGIEITHFGVESIYQFELRAREAGAWFVEFTGGSSYGADLTLHERQTWLGGFVAGLGLTAAIAGVHLSAYGRFDFHILAVDRRTDGRRLIGRGLKREMHRIARGLTAILNEERLEGGRPTMGNLDAEGNVYYAKNTPEPAGPAGTLPGTGSADASLAEPVLTGTPLPAASAVEPAAPTSPGDPDDRGKALGQETNPPTVTAGQPLASVPDPEEPLLTGRPTMRNLDEDSNVYYAKNTPEPAGPAGTVPGTGSADASPAEPVLTGTPHPAASAVKPAAPTPPGDPDDRGKAPVQKTNPPTTVTAGQPLAPVPDPAPAVTEENEEDDEEEKRRIIIKDTQRREEQQAEADQAAEQARAKLAADENSLWLWESEVIAELALAAKARPAEPAPARPAGPPPIPSAAFMSRCLREHLGRTDFEIVAQMESPTSIIWRDEEGAAYRSSDDIDWLIAQVLQLLAGKLSPAAFPGSEKDIGQLAQDREDFLKDRRTRQREFGAEPEQNQGLGR